MGYAAAGIWAQYEERHNREHNDEHKSEKQPTGSFPMGFGPDRISRFHARWMRNSPVRKVVNPAEFSECMFTLARKCA